jgi:hypothetical protein
MLVVEKLLQDFMTHDTLKTLFRDLFEKLFIIITDKRDK